MSIITYYLQMNSVDELIGKEASLGLVINEAKINEFRVNKFLYQLVGEQWQWQDKLSESDAQWEAYVSDPNLRTWIAYYQGSIAGYFELQSDGQGTTEIMYFGLAPHFIGKGFGGYLLSQAILNAWSMTGTNRVFVHTCSLDHASALANYKARGFKLYQSESTEAVC
ncbi:GNAT family N-acetyltransferase [Psychromonas sp. Urea-02u-13]|uniref:GNAT family N-acetyltransferase n=1 Tax=Psychromonas sp. Urea-02u-13 TaxID=2058326 RepID=UPI000C347E3F|nr:GNAT family N-acetyltransferase [Psychromonas sp. Urea-02u-13]PKG38663.1 GNAT family N-acetyltransferase [Psychromonas sp. Urea-02u-13]